MIGSRIVARLPATMCVQKVVLCVPEWQTAQMLRASGMQKAGGQLQAVCQYFGLRCRWPQALCYLCFDAPPVPDTPPPPSEPEPPAAPAKGAKGAKAAAGKPPAKGKAATQEPDRPPTPPPRAGPPFLPAVRAAALRALAAALADAGAAAAELRAPWLHAALAAAAAGVRTADELAAAAAVLRIVTMVQARACHSASLGMLA